MINDIINYIALIALILGLFIFFMLISNRLLSLMANKINLFVSDKIELIILREPSKSYLIFKRIFDIVMSAIFILLLTPLFIIISILIKMTSDGPILFSIERIGLNGKPYRRFKFRTMTIKNIDAESDIPIRQDSRLSKIGKLLRQTTLDELPALINVFKGDISLVGRSDIIIKSYDEEIKKHLLKIKPGLVSMWVLSTDRQSFNTDRIPQFDIYYYNNCSFLLDITLLFGAVLLSFGTLSKY